MSLQTIVELSRRYGADPEYVVAGGGNTSFKDGETLYIKGSGTALAEMTADGFVRMDRKRLAAIWQNDYPASSEERERAVLSDLMAARRPGEEAKRPSVETLLHDILPGAYVVHTHPALVNGLTCSVRGRKAMEELFGASALWIPSTNPGYVLSATVKEAMEAHSLRTGAAPEFIFLQNHGIFVGAATAAGIDTAYERVMGRLNARIGRRPDFSGAAASYGPSAALAAALGRLAAAGGASAAVVFRRDAELARLCADRGAFAPVASAYSPDHIVYAGSESLFLEEEADLERDWRKFLDRTGRKPKIVALKGTGIFGVGDGAKAAALAVELFVDAAKVACYTESFGGRRFMTEDQIDFINNWEVERYRSKISTGNSK